MFVAPTDPDELHAVNLHGVRSADEVVTTLLAVQAWSGAGAWGKQAKPPFPCPVISTSRYRKQPNPDVFRTLLAACARQKVVDVDYDARTREIITKFSPHTIVQTARLLTIGRRRRGTLLGSGALAGYAS